MSMIVYISLTSKMSALFYTTLFQTLCMGLALKMHDVACSSLKIAEKFSCYLKATVTWDLPAISSFVFCHLVYSHTWILLFFLNLLI